MRVIYEPEIENTDFIEIFMDYDEIDDIWRKPKGIVREFWFNGKFLNISIQHKEKDEPVG
jgi:hypothetical protein